MRLYRIPQWFQKLFPDIVWTLPESNQISLTFDDGPDPHFTPRILSLLEKEGITASFFVIGEKANQHPMLIKAIRQSHNVIGIHSYEHQSLLFHSNRFIRNQIQHAKDTIENIISEPVHFFRPPYGHFSPTMINIIQTYSMKMVMWNFMTYDFDNRLSDSELLNIFQKKIRAGDIVVLHDGHRNSARTVRLLPELIRHCQNLGVQLSAIEW